MFGDACLFFSFLEKHGYAGLLKDVFPKTADYARVLMHTFYGVMKTGSKVHCDSYIEKSFASYLADGILIPSLYPDTRFFDILGDDGIRSSFFRSFIERKRKDNPSFGRSCYVDSTPLPNDIQDNPFNAFCFHETGVCELQTMLVLVLDSKSGLPVWYSMIKGNILDLSTINGVVDDVRISLGIGITSLVLDAGYASKDLIQAYSDNRKKLLVRMPLKQGWPHRVLYWKHHDKFFKGKYSFIRKGHEYFDLHDEDSLFGRHMHFYIHVDKNNALTAARQFMTEHEEEFNAMKDCDKDWVMVKKGGGFFILVSNKEMSAREALDEYLGRAEIEGVFKKAKTYLELLPLSKWTVERIYGKILYDCMALIFSLEMEKASEEKELSSVEIAGYTQSLICAHWIPMMTLCLSIRQASRQGER